MCDDFDDLTPLEIIHIWDRWQNRDTINRLAIEFNTTQEVIRKIISLPRRPG